MKGSIPPGWTQVANLHRGSRDPVLIPALLDRYPRARELPWLMLPEHPITFHRVCLPVAVAPLFNALRRVLDDSAAERPSFHAQIVRTGHALVLLSERYGVHGASAIVGSGAEVLRSTLGHLERGAEWS